MPYRLARRTKNAKTSIFTELMEYLSDPSFISFSGGFPAAHLFPVEKLKEAANRVFEDEGQDALQYASTWGYEPLRAWIAKRYQTRFEMDIDPNDILITTGSQQALDLIGKVFLDSNDHIVVEYPSYLGAIQAFAQYETTFHEVRLHDEGLDLHQLRTFLKTYHPKLLYMVPNFQNPTGISYSAANRQAIVEMIQPYDVILVEDDPYGELRYLGQFEKPFKALAPDRTILLGSFSKIISPGIRVGWMVIPKALREPLFNAKEASDLHTSNLDQRIVYQYLKHNPLDTHIKTNVDYYAKQRETMLNAMQKYFPSNVTIAKSEGGMFFWVSLPSHLSAIDIFHKAVTLKVVFVPGDPFYVSKERMNTFRLNYTSASPQQIEEGIQRLGSLLKSLV